MKRLALNRRMVVTAALAALLGACSIIPKGPRPAPPVDTAPAPAPSPTTGLPEDEARHRVALLVPLSGSNGAVGQSIANAATMALLDTGAENLRITTYDTSKGAGAAAREAIAEGNKLILGPLMGAQVGAVLAEARPADVPLITFSNDTRVAGPEVFVMGQMPEQSIDRTVAYARRNGVDSFAILAPEGEYGQRAEAALQTAIARHGGSLVAGERYARGNTSIVSAARRIKARGGYDAVLIAEGARLSALASAELKPGGAGSARILGTELWSGESALIRAPGLRGAWFSAVSDGRFRRFVDSFEARFGSQPSRIATLGYDAVLLTLNVARDWRPGRDFPVDRLRGEDGFIGLDGAFRFQPGGVVERAMEVREVRDGEIVVVDAAPTRFD